MLCYRKHKHQTKHRHLTIPLTFRNSNSPEVLKRFSVKRRKHNASMVRRVQLYWGKGGGVNEGEGRGVRFHFIFINTSQIYTLTQPYIWRCLTISNWLNYIYIGRTRPSLATPSPPSLYNWNSDPIHV